MAVAASITLTLRSLERSKVRHPPPFSPSPRALFCDLAGDCGGVCSVASSASLNPPLPHPPFLRIAMQACFFASRSSVSLWVERKTTLRFSFSSSYPSTPFWVVSYLAVSDAPNPALPHPPWALGLFACRNTQKHAAKIGATGWVMNTAEGTVVGAAEGTAEVVADMKYWLRNTGAIARLVWVSRYFLCPTIRAPAVG